MRFGKEPEGNPWQLPAPLCVHLVKTLLLPRGLVEEYIANKHWKTLMEKTSENIGKNIAAAAWPARQQTLMINIVNTTSTIVL